MKKIFRPPKGFTGSRRSSKIRVEICNLESSLKVSDRRIKDLLKNVLHETGFRSRTPIEISVALVDDVSMRRVNRRFHGADRATDVLAFPMADKKKDSHDRLLGEIIVSIDRARVQAKRFGNTLDKEVALYLVHGLLHLLGYRDHRPKDFDRMCALQDFIMENYFRGILHDF